MNDAELRKVLATPVPHTVVEEDDWYSCHAVGGPAGDKKECTCGADAENELRRAALAEIDALTAELAEARDEAKNLRHAVEGQKETISLAMEANVEMVKQLAEARATIEAWRPVVDAAQAVTEDRTAGRIWLGQAKGK